MLDPAPPPSPDGLALSWRRKGTVINGSMRIRALLAALCLLVPGLALAKPGASPRKKRPVAAAKLETAGKKRAARARETRFLGNRPHGPLAVVRGRGVEEPANGACRTWGKKDEAWRTIGRLGEVVGEATVKALDRYDVTNCDELVMKRSSGKAGAGIFVRGDYTPLAIQAWTLDRKTLTELESRVTKRDRGLVRPPAWQPKEKPLALAARTLAFRTPDGTCWAVVGGRALSIFRRERGRWIVEHEQRPVKDEAQQRDHFMPIAVLDMDGDGAPEVVFHKDDLDSYSDTTLSRSKRGWQLVAAGIWGSTA